MTGHAPPPPPANDAARETAAFIASWTENVGTLDDTPLLSAKDDHGKWVHLTPGALRALLADRDHLRRQLDAAEAAPLTVWWLEGDHDYNDPLLYTDPETAKTAGVTLLRTLNDDAEFPDEALNWVPEPKEDFEGGYELLVHDVHTGITVRPFTVQGAAQPDGTTEPAHPFGAGDLIRYLPGVTDDGRLALWCTDCDPEEVPIWTDADAAEQVTEFCLANLVAIAERHEREHHDDRCACSHDIPACGPECTCGCHDTIGGFSAPEPFPFDEDDDDPPASAPWLSDEDDD